jgi:hypothetical protein
MGDTYRDNQGSTRNTTFFRIGIDDTKPDITGDATVRFRFPPPASRRSRLDLASPANGRA